MGWPFTSFDTVFIRTPGRRCRYDQDVLIFEIVLKVRVVAIAPPLQPRRPGSSSDRPDIGDDIW